MRRLQPPSGGPLDLVLIQKDLQQAAASRRASVSPPVRPSGWFNKTTAPGGSVRCEVQAPGDGGGHPKLFVWCFPSQVASPLKGKDGHPWSAWGEASCTTPVPSEATLGGGSLRLELTPEAGPQCQHHLPHSEVQLQPGSLPPCPLGPGTRCPPSIPSSDFRCFPWLFLSTQTSVSQCALPQAHQDFQAGGLVKNASPSESEPLRVGPQSCLFNKPPAK